METIEEWIDNAMIEEWWGSGNEAFKTYANKLIKQGIEINFIKSMFLDLYHAVASEFGE